MTDIGNITVGVSVWTFPRYGRAIGVLEDPITDRVTVFEVDAND